jgi:hypothetical protein
LGARVGRCPSRVFAPRGRNGGRQRESPTAISHADPPLLFSTTMTKEHPNEPRRREGFAKAVAAAINGHGFALQQAIIKEARRVRFDAKTSKWDFVVSEFPVEVNELETRIDAVFRHHQTNAVMVVECKRVRPEYFNWVFFRTPLVSEKRRSDALFFDRVQFTADGFHRAFGCKSDVLGENAYHIALAVPTNEKSPPEKEKGRGPNPIEDAALQVFRGVNGLIAHFRKSAPQGGVFRGIGVREFAIAPVLVTTAELFACSSDLTAASLTDGTIQVDETHLEEVPFVAFQYPVSRSVLTPRRQNNEPGVEDLEECLDQHFLRTLHVVNAGRFGDFLSRFPSAYIH